MAKQRDVLEEKITDNCRRQHLLQLWKCVVKGFVGSLNKLSASEVRTEMYIHHCTVNDRVNVI